MFTVFRRRSCVVICMPFAVAAATLVGCSVPVPETGGGEPGAVTDEVGDPGQPSELGNSNEVEEEPGQSIVPEEPESGEPSGVAAARRDGWGWLGQNRSKGTCIPTYILIHGYMPVYNEEGENHQHLIQIADVIRYRLDSEHQDGQSPFFDDANIAIWYWETQAAPGGAGQGDMWPWRPSYEATPDEGGKLAAEIRRRMNNGEINADPDSVHIIAYSMGGYVGGIAGAVFKRDHPGHARLGQLTGLDVPEPWEEADPPIRVSDESFGVVDWYPVTGIGGLGILSQRLEDTPEPNVINVVVGGGVTHDGPSGILVWYRANRVWPGNPWISWVAVKPAFPGKVSATGGSLNVEYKLEAQGFEADGSPAALKSEEDDVLFELVPFSYPFAGDPPSRDVLDRGIVSGFSNSMANINVSGTLRDGFGLEWVAFLDAIVSAGGPVFARSHATFDSVGTFEVTREPTWPTECGRLPSPVLVSYSSTMDQMLRWEEYEKRLLATGTIPFPFSPTDPPLPNHLSLITLSGPGSVEVRAHTVDEAYSEFFADVVKIVGSVNLTCWRPAIDGNDVREIGKAFHRAFVCSAGADLYIGQQAIAEFPIDQMWSSLELNARAEAEVVWGQSLSFSPVPGNPARLNFKPEEPGLDVIRYTLPGLYVIRYTLTSENDRTSASGNATLFVAGNIK